MTAKNLLLAVLVAATGFQTGAQTPTPTTVSNAPSHDELMRRALLEAGTNHTATVPPATGAAGDPTNRTLPTAINRPPGRKRAPALPAPTITTQANNPVVLPPPTTPASAPAEAAPAPIPAPAPAPTAAPIGGLPVTTHTSNEGLISNPDEIVPAGSINFTAASLDAVLQIYSEYVGRNLLRPSTLPEAKIVLKQTTPLTKLEVVRALEAAMALNNISVVNVGEKFVTITPTADAWKIPGRINTNDSSGLSELGSIVTHIAQLKYTKPTELVQILTPFASGTAANPILPVDGSGILVLRDNVANVKRMLEMIDKVDVTVQSEFISEVIPIKYAKAEEIATALSSVGGGGGTTVGNRPTGGTGASGARGTTGFAGQQGGYNPSQPGATPTPTPSSGASFSDRLNNIIKKAASSGDLQILGTTKIIADIRSNSLLVFATRQDMQMIKDIIAKLDVVLAQVLIETVIMDVAMGDKWEFGVSAAQNVKTDGSASTVGGFNNSNPFFNFLNNATNNFPGNATTTLPDSATTYFGKFGTGPSWEVALKAAASDSRVNVIQKPQVLTSHATPASIFIGSTVPYVSGTYYGYSSTGGSTSYQQLKVGIGLNVTPFINQEGLVVMKIDETIDEVSGFTDIQNVGKVPTTTSRTLSAEVAVRDRESIILGGFIRNSDSKNKSGVPLLKDIPLLGALFSSRSSDKSRSELIVLMRPTVLRTPEAAAQHVSVEKERMPGVRAAERELDKVELRRAEDERGRAKKPKFNEVTPFTPEEIEALNKPAATHP